MAHPEYLSSETKNTLTGTLFVVATPIGNLADLSPRAQKILQEVAWIAAEDTRVTGQLCRHIGSTAQLFSLREHNERQAAERVLQLLQQGINVAQVSDAGTPAISDPGARLVETIRTAGLPVVALPGACAASTALSASGIPCEHFYFHGFLPAKSSGRKKALSQLSQRNTAFIFYEAPHRILESLHDMVSVFGETHTRHFLPAKSQKPLKPYALHHWVSCGTG
jgi:16S rRNA (cytidine1402-2'-O)-methyltransferase